MTVSSHCENSRGYRCDVVPVRALQTAGDLFDSDGSCEAAGDTILPMNGPFAELLYAWDGSRRALQSSADAELSLIHISEPTRPY